MILGESQSPEIRRAAEKAVSALYDLAAEIRNLQYKEEPKALSERQEAIEIRDLAEKIEYAYAPDFDEGVE